ncbi:hypothetical protein F4813DRAFT_361717 [Daldinia decipiens]|uniref:uncharacterized protein n=1 Tax=Daldinia decipiens TaxID=326647 RepID=UPI0020C41AC7|nr:uncharacterized protein F4813DRAFT_361717 [Daldinia decipiens]KAI1657132.1 hypothetical protein F4813DRAFT_361717 [Daldinia decipiens]
MSHPRTYCQERPPLQGVGAQFETGNVDYTEIAFALDELPSSPLDVSLLLKEVLSRSIDTNDSRIVLLESNAVGSLSLRSSPERGGGTI